MSDQRAYAVWDGVHGFIDHDNHFEPTPFDTTRGGKGALRGFGKDKKHGFMDRNGAVVIPATFEKTGSFFVEDRLWFKADGKYGFMDSTGRVAIEPIYAKINGNVRQGRVKASKDAKKWGYLDLDGNPLTKFKYKDSSHHFVNDYAAVHVGRRWGYIDREGKEVIKPTYTCEFGSDFSGNGLASVHEGNMRSPNPSHYFLRPDGSRLTDMDLESGGNFSEGLARFRDRERGEGFLDGEGQVAFWTRARRASASQMASGSAHEPVAFSDRLLPAHDLDSDDYRHGYLGPDGEWAIPATHRHTYRFENGFAMVGNDDWKWTWIDREGRPVGDYRYGLNAPGGRNKPRSFHEERVWAWDGSNWAMVDTDGVERTEFVYSGTGDFSDGRALVRRDGKWGMVDREGTEVIPCTYDKLGGFAAWPLLPDDPKASAAG